MHTARQFTRFAGVGVVGTAAHYAVLIALVERAGIDSVIASTLGFVAGAFVNYCLNRTFTFASPVAFLPGMAKFFVIATLGAVLNAGLMLALVHYARLHYVVAQLLATSVVLVWNFVGNRIWTFAHAPDEP
jgi:putative flippase GtrA